MGRIVQLQQQQASQASEPTLQEMIAQVLTIARRRTGLGPGEFADRINEHAARSAKKGRRKPGLGPTAILAYEAAEALPLTDHYFTAIWVAGFPVRETLMRYITSDGDAATSA